MENVNFEKKPKDYDDFTWLGTIVSVHGIHGEIKVFPHTNFPDYYLNLNSVYLEKKSELKEYLIESIRFHKNHWLLKIANINDRNKAESLKKLRILIHDSDLKPLGENEYFQHQLIGCIIQDLEGNGFGKVVDIIETGANDVYVVDKEDSEFLIPAVEDIIKKTDIKNKIIYIDPIPGLIEN